MDKNKIFRLILLILDIILIALLATYCILCAVYGRTPKLWLIIMAGLDLMPSFLYYILNKYNKRRKEKIVSDEDSILGG